MANRILEHSDPLFDPDGQVHDLDPDIHGACDGLGDDTRASDPIGIEDAEGHDPDLRRDGNHQRGDEESVPVALVHEPVAVGVEAVRLVRGLRVVLEQIPSIRVHVRVHQLVRQDAAVHDGDTDAPTRGARSRHLGSDA